MYTRLIYVQLYMDGYNHDAYPIISYIFESILIWQPVGPFLEC